MLALTLLFAAALSAPAQGAVTVNTTNDSNAPGGCLGAPGDCSLRQALGSAASGETVVVPAGTYVLTLGSLSIGQAVAIQGEGARSTSVVANGSTNAFAVGSPGPVVIAGMAISAGHVQGSSFLHGGAVYNAAGSMLTLESVSVSGTTLEKTDASPSAVRGAGIANNGTLTISNSTVSENVAIATGEGNGSQGAGLFNSGGTVTIVNSTIAGNSEVAIAGASSSGAAIENLPGSLIELRSVTVAANVGAPAIHNVGTVNVGNTIVANGASGNCEGQLTSLGGNLESADQCGFHASGDQTGKDPLLAALRDNGGQTNTMALAVGSPALDTGGPGCPPTDQRGVPRPQGPGCDVGAFELEPARAAPPSNAFSFGKLKRNRRRGTARLIVVVPGPGDLTLAGKGVGKPKASAAASKAVSAAGPVGLLIRAKGRARRKLNRRGKVRLRLRVTYTPSGGSPNTKRKTVKLIKRRRPAG
jgi:hypothetical protein